MISARRSSTLRSVVFSSRGELRHRLLARAHELQLALEQQLRLVQDAQAIGVARVALPLVAERRSGLLRMGEVDDCLEREAEQVLHAQDLLQMGDVGLAVETVRALAAIAGTAEQAELLVVADRARGDSEALRDRADAIDCVPS